MCPLYVDPYLAQAQGPVTRRLSHIEGAGARSQKEDLLQSKIRSNHWYICMYSLSKYRQIYSASHVVCQDTLLWYCMLCNPTLIAPQKLGAFLGANPPKRAYFAPYM